LEILANGFTTNSQFNASQNAFVVQPNSNIEVRLNGDPLGVHPIHTHGHVASIISSSSGGPRNCVNPPLRDVMQSGNVNTPPAVVRIRTDNPGAWFIHCHIDWHLEAGLAAVMIEDPNGIRRGDVKPNAAWQQLCQVYNNLSPDLQ